MFRTITLSAGVRARWLQAQEDGRHDSSFPSERLTDEGFLIHSCLQLLHSALSSLPSVFNMPC